MNDTLDSNLVEEIVNKVKENDDIIDVHDVLTHKYGEGKAFMSMHAEMDASSTLLKAHEIIDKIERNIKEEYNIEFLIHIDPIDLKDGELQYIKDIINKIVIDIDESLTTHDIRFSKSEERIYFDLVLPYKYQSRSKELLDLVKKEIARKLDYKVSIELNYK